MDDTDVELALDEVLAETIRRTSTPEDDEEIPGEIDTLVDAAETILPKQDDEFRCNSCRLLKKTSQLADRARASAATASDTSERSRRDATIQGACRDGLRSPSRRAVSSPALRHGDATGPRRIAGDRRCSPQSSGADARTRLLSDAVSRRGHSCGARGRHRRRLRALSRWGAWRLSTCAKHCTAARE